MSKDLIAEVDRALERSTHFLLNKSIDLHEKSETYGGFYGLVNVNGNDEEPFIFSEITAYAVKMLLKLYSWTHEKRYRDMAIVAGNWLLTAQYKGDNANANGAFYDKFYIQKRAFDNSFFVYPNATCIGALADLYDLTQEHEYLNAAKRCMKWLLDTMPYNVGSDCVGFRESYNMPKRSFSDKVYPYESICVPNIILEHSKLLELSAQQHEMISSAISWGLRSLDASGYFPFFYSTRMGKFNRIGYTHFTVYPFYNLMGYPLLDLHNKGFANSLEVAKRLASWIMQIQDKDGGFFTYYFNGQHSWHKQSPPTAQVACALTQMWHQTRDDRYLNSALAASKWLIDNQIKEGPNSGGYHWIYPNKSLNALSKPIIRAKERFKLKIEKDDELEYLGNYSGFLDRLPIWTVQFAIEAFYQIKNLHQSI